MEKSVTEARTLGATNQLFASYGFNLWQRKILDVNMLTDVSFFFQKDKSNKIGR